jgi:CheY-like chemotaxis protein/anti-sigma regulatory factor (Ser/Thr protein kinase)
MSHDIRTPMNAIIGYTDMAIRHQDDTEQVRDCLDKIKVSGNHLLNLINDILDMSRMESGQVSLEPAPCDLSELLKDLQTLMEGQAQSGQIEMQWDDSAVQNKKVLCDALRMNQIFINLLGNAVKFTHAGGHVRLTVRQDSDDAHPGIGMYTFHVVDDGIGIGEEFQEHIFERFTRERTSTVSGLQGTGLGLSITKDIVDMMGGTIKIASEVGKGTDVEVKLALALQPENGTEKTVDGNDNGLAEQITEKRCARKHILLAEDNPLNREIAVDILEEQGFQVKTAVNGATAVDIIEKSKKGDFDAILMDIQMPVMDGYEATRAIRQLEDSDLADIPIVALSANAFSEDMKKARDAGMNGYVTKPIDINHLVETLDSLYPA